MTLIIFPFLGKIRHHKTDIITIVIAVVVVIVATLIVIITIKSE